MCGIQLKQFMKEIYCLKNIYNQKEAKNHWFSFHFKKLEKEQQIKLKGQRNYKIINETENKQSQKVFLKKHFCCCCCCCYC